MVASKEEEEEEEEEVEEEVVVERDQMPSRCPNSVRRHLGRNREWEIKFELEWDVQEEEEKRDQTLIVLSSDAVTK